jgi:hypothetical protein
VDKVSVLGFRCMSQAVCMVLVVQVGENLGRAGQQGNDEQVQGRIEAWSPWRPWRIRGGGSNAAFARGWRGFPTFCKGRLRGDENVIGNIGIGRHPNGI